jgi:hypothetical protein
MDTLVIALVLVSFFVLAGLAAGAESRDGVDRTGPAGLFGR